MNIKQIKLTSDEIWPLLNVLNEICNGLHINDFENSIGVEREIVVNLMDKISQEESKQEAILALNDFELTILNKSFKEVFAQIEEWEFQTRVGVSIEEANRIRDKLESSER